MTLSKGGRPTFRRTAASTAGITFDVGIPEAAPLLRPAPMIGGHEFNGYGHMLMSSRYFRKNGYGPTGGGDHVELETADFLRNCGRCHRRLAPGRDIYMYRGDTAFCSLECREQQIIQDERKERRAAAEKNGESHPPELATAATEVESVAAA